MTRNTLSVWMAAMTLGTLGCSEEAPTQDQAYVEEDAGTATAANAPPAVHAGLNRTIMLPTSALVVNGTATDPEGDPLTYLWKKVSGPSVTLSSQTTRSVHLSGLVAGTYSFSFRATDSAGAYATDAMKLIVLPYEEPEPGQYNLWLRPNNRYDTLVFLPASYDPDSSARYRLVVSLHGIGGITLNADHTGPRASSLPEGFIRQLAPEKPLAATFEAVVIAPHGPNIGGPLKTTWNTGNVHALVLEALERYHIDPDRVVITGLSNGGRGTGDQIKSFRSTYAGAMIIAFGPPSVPDPCVFAAFPIWASGNANDSIFNVAKWTGSNGFYPRVTACAGYTGELMVTVRPSGGHGGWDTFWERPDVQTWLVSQKRAH